MGKSDDSQVNHVPTSGSNQGGIYMISEDVYLLNVYLYPLKRANFHLRAWEIIVQCSAPVCTTVVAISHKVMAPVTASLP